MKDDELSTILDKTRDYLSFIKASLSKNAIALKDEDSNAMEKIETYLKVFEKDSEHWNHIKESEHKSVLSKCFRSLQRLDRIAKEYKLLHNGSAHP